MMLNVKYVNVYSHSRLSLTGLWSTHLAKTKKNNKNNKNNNTDRPNARPGT